MDIWVPEPLYRIFPKVGIALGFLFLATATGPVSMALSIALLGYGAAVLAARVI